MYKRQPIDSTNNAQDVLLHSFGDESQQRRKDLLQQPEQQPSFQILIQQPPSMLRQVRAAAWCDEKSLGGTVCLYRKTVFPLRGDQHFSSSDRLVMQIHYTTTGKVTKDQTRLGLHYVDNPPRQTLSNPITVNENIYIPAGDRNYETTASILLEADSYLYAMSPHMHYRGKSMKYTAVFPDGSTEQLLSVPNYQFRWQMNYWLTEPKFLPAGTTVVTNGTFDNSSANPSNPNANVDVVWGAQSWEEMFIGWMAIAIDNE